MKIGIVCYPTYGGSGVMATELGIALAHKGHQVHFISYKRPARLTNFYKDIYLHEVNSMEYPLFQYAPYESSLTSKIVDVAQHEKLDILHVHYAIPHAAVAYMSKEVLKTHGIYLPVVTTLHGTDITLVGLDESMAPVVEFSINNSDVVTAVSASLKAQTESYFNIEKDIKVIHNFIDTERFTRKENKIFRQSIAPNDEKIVVHTSNFRKVKRVQDVVKVFAKIHAQMPSKLFLIGDGPERPHIESLCRTLGICNDIIFLGKQDAIEEILSLSDLFILPSQNESFGLAALEAMSCGVPVISTDVGGLPEVNINGHTGYTCALGDIDAMYNRSMEILSDHKKLETFRKNARSEALKFQKSIITPQYEQLYKQVLNPSLTA